MERKGLGKGLGALISTGIDGRDEAGLLEIPVDWISANPYQPRQDFDDARLTELVHSIEEHGILQPVIVKQTGYETYELVAGERRLRAAQRAGLRSVPAVVKEYAPRQMLEVALIENLQREDINAVDAAVAYQRLRVEFEMTQEEVAQRVGKAQSTVANTLRLLSLPQPILDSLRRGEITEGHARALLQAPEAARLTAWEDIRRRGLSVRDTERLGRELSTQPREAKPSAPELALRKDPNYASVEEALQHALGTKVTLHATRAGGRIEIDFYSADHLEDVVDRLLRATTGSPE